MYALFLKKNDLKEITLIHKLYYNDFYLKQDLLTDLKISRSTLERYIIHINDCLSDNNIKSKIVADKTTINFSIEDSNLSFNTIITYLVKNQLSYSLSYKLLTLVVLHKKISVSLLLEQLFISENYLLKQLSTLNSALTKYDIHLKLSKNDVSLDGELPNVLLFSFLIHDSHKKLYMSQDSDLKEIYSTNLELVKPEFLDGMSDIQVFRAHTLQYQFDLFHKEILNFTYPDEDISALITQYGRAKQMFVPAYQKKINNDFIFGFATYIISLLFPPNNLEIKFLSDFFSTQLPNNQLTKELIAFSNTLENEFTLKSDHEIPLFTAGLIMNYVYVSLFNVNIKADFSNYKEMNRLLNNLDSVETNNQLSVKEFLNIDKFPIISPIIAANKNVFDTYLNTSLLTNPKQSLYILLDFESDVSFEYSLKMNILKFFGKDTVIITTNMNKADMIVSDKIFHTDTGTFFFHFSNTSSKNNLIELFKLISSKYINKNF